MAQFYIGQIMTGGWNFAPRSFANCQGQLLPISQNTALFSLLGTQYGGNGTTNFALPDLRGRAMIGWGNGPGLSNFVIGQSGGTESVTLNTAQMPAHNHTASFASTSTLNASPAKATAQLPTTGSFLAKSVDSSGAVIPLIYVPAGANADVALGGLNVAGNVTVNPNGGNQPFANRSPYLAITVCIALQGIFPSRS